MLRRGAWRGGSGGRGKGGRSEIHDGLPDRWASWTALSYEKQAQRPTAMASMIDRWRFPGESEKKPRREAVLFVQGWCYLLASTRDIVTSG